MNLTVDRSGNVLVETAFILPLLFGLSAGTFAVGLDLDRHLQAQQLARASASILGDTPEAYRDTARLEQLIARSAAGTDLALGRGRTTVILSAISIAQSGRNRNQPVVRHRFRTGTFQEGASRLAAPARIDEGGHVADPDNDPTAVAALPPGVRLPPGLTIYGAEVIHDARDLALPGLLAQPRVYARVFF